jgi:formylglycine-generating enzyme required for sulfatase activity
MVFLSHRIIAFVLLLVVAEVAPLTAAVDFDRDVRPLLEATCISCHDAEHAEGDLVLESNTSLLKGGASGPAVVPGKPDESRLFTSTILPQGHAEIMPPSGDRLDTVQTDMLRAWIAEGAVWPDGKKLEQQPRIGFVEHIQPVLEQNCVGCHSGEKHEGELDLSSREKAFSSGESGASIVPFRPTESLCYTYSTLDADNELLMPPKQSGGPLDKEVTDKLKQWIAQGAVWPEGVTLKQKAKAASYNETHDDLAFVAKVHALIAEKAQQGANQSFDSYEGEVPSTGAKYSMIALPGGQYRMGSPPSESQREEIEGPQVNVQVAPFWIGKFEVTWDEYEPFMITQVDRKKTGARVQYDPEKDSLLDAVSQPTPPYVEMSFGMGQKGFPAISMTQHAANKYCQWLSVQTGHFYRLPTEAEWEYACRAGTTTAYSFGDDPAKLDQYAWYYENSQEKYQKVGKKKPNPWGLHDMHGNVMEWTADRFDPNYFLIIKDSPLNPLLKPETLYPRSVRGGGWDDDAEQLRSAARRGSDATWKQQDPQLPKSIWYHTDAPWLGFRIVRPKDVPSVEEMYFYWNSAKDKF